MRNTILIFLLVLLNLNALSQIYKIQGRVVDSETKEPLAFVNLIANGGKFGATTDIDGKFLLNQKDPIEKIKFSYVGYEEKTLEAESLLKVNVVKLKRKQIFLPQVEVFPKKNPAHRIIQNVIENRKINNPEKLNSFSYTAYDKMYFTINADTAVRLDTISSDSSFIKMRQFFDEQHLFMMESVTQRKFLAPDKNYEKVVASRMSGFKDPVIVFLISQMQSTSFYDEIIHILNKNYINPISKGSTSKYFFLMEDTTYTTAGDSIFIISYRPRSNTNFDGMKGILSINSNQWAIQNVMARPAEDKRGMDVKIQQMYELIDGKQWFPVQLNTEIILGRVNVELDEKAFHVAGIGKSYIRNIELNPELVASEFSNIEVEVVPNAHKRDSSFWQLRRTDSLDAREKRTYQYMDSIGREYKFDEIARSVDIMLTGQIPWGPVNFDLDKFIGYNDYEGLYLGLGGNTNDRLSPHFQIGGYAGYGFKDKRAKYGGHLATEISRRHNLSAGVSYFYDAAESASVEFFDETDHTLKPENFRQFMIKRMNMTENFSGFIRFTTLKYLTVNFSLSRQSKEAFMDYLYAESEGESSVLYDDFIFTEAGLSLRYAYKENFLQTRRSKVNMGTTYPIFWLQYIRGLEGVLDGQYEFNRYDLKIEDSFYLKYLGKTSLRLMAGYIDSPLPYCNLYNGNGSYRSVTLYAPFSFATMRMNEFLSDRYVAFYFYHDFENLIFGGKKFKPELAIATNVAYGTLDNPAQHVNADFKTLDQIYYESGILINNLLDIRLYKVGLGAFYRYGPYAFNNVRENIAWKISIEFAF